VKAWQVNRHGEPRDVLELTEVPEPTPGPGQLLVRVLAAAANFPDVLLCRGTYQVQPPLPFCPGVELCGEVVAAGANVPGPDVPEFSVGDRVIGGPALPFGAFAEFALMDAADAAPAPDVLDNAEAAPFFITYQTGWFGLHRRARLAAGETLLVHAAAGGVGSGAVQLGKATGARVIGVVGGPEKAQVARELGADVVVDRYREDFVAIVKEVTDGRGADVVYDSVGGDAFRRSVKCIAFEGRILIVGFASGDIPAAALNHALLKNYSILGLHWGLYRRQAPRAVRYCYTELTRLATAGKIRPLISERLRLADVPDGLQRLAEGATTGRIVFLP
jgi:NADPH:quinone reductase